jgi:hypothetical protein
MTYVFREPTLGQTPINGTAAATTASVNTSTAAAGTIFSAPGPAGRSTPGRLGCIAKAYDPKYGEGEFIYLLGVASTAVGSVVNWGGVDANGKPTYQTALEGATPIKGQPLAVAMSANGANQFGWYQISGQAVAAVSGTAFTAGVAVFLAAGGTVTPTPAAGAQVENAISVSVGGVPSAGFVVLSIDRPFAEGQIT